MNKTNSLADIANRLGSVRDEPRTYRMCQAKLSLMWALTPDLDNKHKIGTQFYRGLSYEKAQTRRT